MLGRIACVKRHPVFWGPCLEYGPVRSTAAWRGQIGSESRSRVKMWYLNNMNSGGPNKHTWTPRYGNGYRSWFSFTCSPAQKRFCQWVSSFVEEKTCKLCEKRFATSFSLKTHYSEVHVDEKKRTCKCCRKIFKTVASMKRHMQSAHKGLLIFNMNEDQYTYAIFIASGLTTTS